MRTVRAVRLETGRWRLAAWAEPKSTLTYSPLLFAWITSPPGRPLVDLLLRADGRAAKVMCEEVERRSGAAM